MILPNVKDQNIVYGENFVTKFHPEYMLCKHMHIIMLFLEQSSSWNAGGLVAAREILPSPMEPTIY